MDETLEMKLFKIIFNSMGYGNLKHVISKTPLSQLNTFDKIDAVLINYEQNAFINMIFQ